MVSALLRRIKDAIPFWGFPVIILLIIAITLAIVVLVSGSGKRKTTYSAEGLESRYSFHRWDESEHGPVDPGLQAQASSAPTEAPATTPVVQGASASSSELSSGTDVPGPDAVFVFKAYGRAHGVGLCM